MAELLKSSNFEIEEGFIYYASWDKFKSFIKFADECIGLIKLSSQPREIVMESWFLLDYLIRSLLLEAFDITEYSFDDCDLHYKYLPQSFDSCLDNLYTIIKAQRSVKAKYKYAEDYLQYPHISMPGSFINFLSTKYKRFLDDFQNIEKEYYMECESLYYEKFVSSGEGLEFPNNEKPVKTVSKGWLDSLQNINDDWVKGVKSLNKIRNIAAHNYDREKIYDKFGCNGANKLDVLRTKCLELIENALRIKIVY